MHFQLLRNVCTCRLDIFKVKFKYGELNIFYEIIWNMCCENWGKFSFNLTNDYWTIVLIYTNRFSGWIECRCRKAKPKVISCSQRQTGNVLIMSARTLANTLCIKFTRISASFSYTAIRWPNEFSLSIFYVNLCRRNNFNSIHNYIPILFFYRGICYLFINHHFACSKRTCKTEIIHGKSHVGVSRLAFYK